MESNVRTGFRSQYIENEGILEKKRFSGNMSTGLVDAMRPFIISLAPLFGRVYVLYKFEASNNTKSGYINAFPLNSQSEIVFWSANSQNR